MPVYAHDASDHIKFENVKLVKPGDTVTAKLKLKVLRADTYCATLELGNGRTVIVEYENILEVEQPEPKPAEPVIPPIPAPGTAKVILWGDKVYKRSVSNSSVWETWEERHGRRGLASYHWETLVRSARAAGDPLVLCDANKAIV